ncbi:UNVERIFIED_CONTAM: hypothetical protein N8J90_18915 [Halobacillus marinus]|uniref:hypothetical protein n=1 Tax=Halobacillus sp. BAB-2008 TaxID=1246484 RepID=UPI0002A51E99|nr:hypothetical protein [Halobacillus sp. BAB-2008]ELK47885.1 hypothetical protein D479_04965 [Halobacillus sp. BAB-2008]
MKKILLFFAVFILAFGSLAPSISAQTSTETKTNNSSSSSFTYPAPDKILKEPVVGTDADECNCGGGSDWTYHTTYNGDNRPTKWTVGAISISLAGVTKIPATATVITNIANMTYQLYSDTIYYTQSVFKKGSKLRPDYKYVTTFYADSAHTKVIESNVVSYASYPY